MTTKIMLFSQLLHSCSRLVETSNFKFKYNLLGRFFVSTMPTVMLRCLECFFLLLHSFPFFVSLFSLFHSRLALAAVFVIHLLRSFAMKLCSRNFLFLSWVMWSNVYSKRHSYIKVVLYNIFKFFMESRMSLFSPWAGSWCIVVVHALQTFWKVLIKMRNHADKCIALLCYGYMTVNVNIHCCKILK